MKMHAFEICGIELTSNQLKATCVIYFVRFGESVVGIVWLQLCTCVIFITVTLHHLLFFGGYSDYGDALLILVSLFAPKK